MRAVVGELEGWRTGRQRGQRQASQPVDVGSVRSTLVWSAALYLLLGAALAGWLPWWLMAGAVPLLYARLALALHETMHRHPSPEVGLWLRLCILLESPLVLGYREHRALHLRHHRFNGGPGDPDRPLIATAPPRALLCALLVPERAFFEWVRDRGLDARLARGCAVRAVLFLAVVAIDPAVFLAYWLSLRLSIGLSGFVFHHVLHAREGRVGSFALPGGPRVLRLGRWLFGREPMLILTRHRAHHLWPRTPLGELPDLPDDLELPSGRLGPAVRHAALMAASRTPRKPPCAA
jgi:fatty acid desaturase